MMCLLDVYSKGKLLPECAAELKSRVEMWDSAVEVKKKTSQSKSRNFCV